ncbi:tRNA-splicing endonuclease subunit Sen54 isoform X2 [Engraulis encrasicolus]|uniref:tRNA-splicing endonuclease subunit Sen54 isoform X2 n=1 Tax=Engraulis encrasicolus TaxID=184585 RepID=UPI002FD28F3A
MAESDTSTTQPKPKPHFCSEILSPSELFAARSRSHKIPVRGQKDFLPSQPHTHSDKPSDTHSDKLSDTHSQQQQRLEQSLNEHWTLVAEERVERLGSVVRGLWMPEEDVVELQTPAGKFWQTMGYAADGKQYLLPEEALYLMECELPFSIEEGYQKFLSTDHDTLLTLQQYQVYGHLKRLGYVVIRFDPSSVQSVYEQQLNLPQTRDRHRKRKRSQSPPHRPKDQQPSPPSGEAETEEEKKAHTSPPPPQSPAKPDPPQEEEQEQEREEWQEKGLEEGCEGGRSWWIGKEKMQEENIEEMEVSEVGGSDDVAAAAATAPTLALPRWDFSRILFPDLGSSSSSSSSAPPALPAPPPSLLPGALEVSECHVAPWLQRLNLRPDRPTRRERQDQDQNRSHYRQGDGRAERHQGDQSQRHQGNQSQRHQGDQSQRHQGDQSQRHQGDQSQRHQGDQSQRHQGDQSQRHRGDQSSRQRHHDDHRHRHHADRHRGDGNNSRHRDERHRDDRYRDERHRDDRHRDDRYRDDRYRDERHHRDVNADREVQRCRNWVEFQALQERRRSRQRNHGNRPPHLWEGAVTPLSQPGQASSHGDLLGQIGIIESSKLQDQPNSLSIPPEWQLSFDVYQPDTAADYKKSNPGKPYTRMAVCSFDGPVPQLCVLKWLSSQSGSVPVTYAVVDHGDISFYCYTHTRTPIDTYT